MTEPVQCEFFLFRYVPDVVKGEFINIGIAIHKSGDPFPALVRFTRDWSRVQALAPNADVALLEAVEADIIVRLKSERVESVVEEFLRSWSNSLQIAGPHACLALTLETELDRLMKLYVESRDV